MGKEQQTSITYQCVDDHEDESHDAGKPKGVFLQPEFTQVSSYRTDCAKWDGREGEMGITYHSVDDHEDESRDASEPQVAVCPVRVKVEVSIPQPPGLGLEGEGEVLRQEEGVAHHIHVVEERPGAEAAKLRAREEGMRGVSTEGKQRCRAARPPEARQQRRA
jgi:hypothetical protein